MKQFALKRRRVIDFSQFRRRQRSDFTASFFLLLFLASLVCYAFSGARPPLVLTAANNGTTVTVSSGAQIIVRLSDISASTGYRWNFVATGKHVVELQSTRYLAPTFVPGSPPMVGTPGIVEFTFLAQSSGSAPLRFVQRRSWETALPPAQRFGVVIRVIPPSPR